ncbi:MAG TPA: DUF748 domain-containing protein, partial [Burkholderiaceae bacterium]
MQAKKISIIAGVTLAVLAAGGAIALHFATRALQTRVQSALGPNSEVAEVIVHWSSIEMRGVHVRGPADWPASEILRADRIVVRPDLRALISAQLHVSKIEVENPYLSILRGRDGHVRLLPGIVENAPKSASPSVPAAHPVEIGGVVIHGGAVEFFDASIRQPPHMVRLEQLEAEVDDIHVPNQAGHMQLKLDGVVKGVQGDGKAAIEGWLDPVTLDSDVTTTLSGVDLITLQPYLIKAAETGVRRGKLDMTLHSRVQNKQLHAPGSVTLTGLELDSGNGAMATFMGVPRRAVVSSLKDKGGRIVVPFTLAGNL